MAWLNQEQSLLEAICPQAVRPGAGVPLAADRFPPDFFSLLPLLSFPSRLLGSIALCDRSFSCILFEPYLVPEGFSPSGA